MKRKIVIVHNKIQSDAPDVVDVLEQRDLVCAACVQLGYDTACLDIGDDLKQDFIHLKNLEPDLVFHLVEDVWGKGELVYFGAAILTAENIPYTGNPLEALFLTANKVLAKQMMRLHGLPTAEFFSTKELDKLNTSKTYIAKPIREDASINIHANFVFKTSEKNKMEQIKQLPASHFFIEEFIDGREFNISILANADEPEVLPLAEIEFLQYFDDKPKILDYDTKWNETSAGYNNTVRSFDTLDDKPLLKNTLIKLCKKTWQVFNLHGYARIDFRVDANDNIFILEINANPCIAPDSGFVAAVEHAGYTHEEMIERILNDINLSRSYEV